ncbi:hypothetical protein [Alkalihalobacillus deserti]|uniref:hypothetical protein n=1 Tax=Alkalihalobacillus deserti TaxID=2879466 RepID=UPI001D153D48|nr:hypothetical protein [Alkalihalobacillus deserti]
MNGQNFTDVLKESFIKITFNGKTLLAFLFYIVILFAIWRYHLQIERYNESHGVISPVEPREQALLYMTYFSIITLSIYLLIIIRNTVKQVK